MVGASPRLLQEIGTNRLVAASVTRDLRAGGRFHGVLENYQKGGDPYLCEIDVRPVTGPDDRPIAFIAFEREVVRRRGRPSRNGAGRYRPIATAGMEAPPVGGGPGLFS